VKMYGKIGEEASDEGDIELEDGDGRWDWTTT